MSFATAGFTKNPQLREEKRARRPEGCAPDKSKNASEPKKGAIEETTDYLYCKLRIKESYNANL